MIEKAYYWFWHDLLQRQEPFTYEFRRQKSAWGWAWWFFVISFSGFWVWLVKHIASNKK